MKTPPLFLWLLATAILSPTRLIGEMAITEFMASNAGSLADEDGEFSDWIELHNPDSGPADIGGYYLTDDLAALTRWQIPAGVVLSAGEYRVVFASGKDRGSAATELHTNFSLGAGGESLALVADDGSTVVSQFDAFPSQRADVSYGVSGQVNTLVDGSATARVLVPSHGSLGTTWTGGAEPFDDSTWTAGANGIGYDNGVAGGGVLLEGAKLSSDFMFKYEQNVGAHTQDLDNNGTADFFPINAGELPSLSGGVATFGSGNRYRTDFNNSIIRENFGADEPFTIEVRVKALTSGGGEGSRGTMGVFYRDSDGSGAVSYVGRDETGYLGTSYTTVDTASNTDAFHILRMAKTSAGEVWLWRDGALINPGGTALAESSVGSNAWGLYLGDTGSTNAGDWQLDYIRITPGAFAPGDTALYTNLINTDIGAELAGNNSAYLRLPFNVADAGAYDLIQLRARYDDGFVAYLNGTQVAIRNAPGTPLWNSAASPRPDADALEATAITLHLPSLQTGENVLAVQLLNEGTTADRALGLFELDGVQSSGVAQFFPDPTPGAPNDTGVQGFVGDTAFDVDRGFFTAPFDVSITSSTPDAEIYFTTDGSVPSPTNGTLYTAPVTISTTTPLRAVATKFGFASSNVDTQTYLFLDDVLTQDGAGLPTPTNPSESDWDYEMDENVVNDPRYSPGIIDDLKALPTMSVVLPAEDMWGASGIYNNPEQLGLAWERACSMEMIYPDDPARSFQEDAGIRIHGAGSRYRNLGKKSLRLTFRKVYGAGALNERFFGPGTPTGFDNIVLRGSYFDSWTVHTAGSGTGIGYNNALQFRTDFGHVTHTDMGAHGILRNWSHLYINGIYWGIYNTHERPDENFATLHLGGDDDDYDVLKQRPRGQSSGSPPEVVHGDRDEWDMLMGMMGQNFASDSVYQNALAFIDRDQFIDYILLNLWGGNADWPHNNWYAIRNRPDDGPFIFYNWDPENFMFGLNTDRTGVSTNNSPGIIYDRLRDNAEFQLSFADRVRLHLYNGGALTEASNTTRMQDFVELLEGPMTPESARWGDTRTEPPLNTIDDWLPTVNDLLDDFMPARNGVLLSQLRNRDLWPDTEPADFNQHGGSVPAGFGVTMSAPSGTVYFTTDGSDPRLEGGAISGSASIYTTAFPLTQDTEIQTRARANNGDWSALTAATFIIDTVTATSANLVISEIHYRPADATPDEELAGLTDRDAFEFIEIYNFGSDPIDLTGVRFAGGIFYDFADNTTLAAGARLILVNDRAAFAERYGLLLIGGEYTGQLNNDGETVTLLAADDSIIHQLTYNDQLPWPTAADGDGYSLTLIAPGGTDATMPSSWRPSASPAGSPTTDDATTFPGGTDAEFLAYATGGIAPAIATGPDGTPIITFGRNLAADDAVLAVQTSTDLESWNPAGTGIELVSETPSDDGNSTITYRLVTPFSDRRFVRLQADSR